MCGNVKCFRLEPQGKKTKVSKHDARQLFSYYNYFLCVYDFTDIDECKGNHSCRVNAMQFYNPPEKNLLRKATKADL